MIARGMTNADIAQTLVLSNHTIKTHINRIFAKTGSANRTEASRFADAHGPYLSGAARLPAPGGTNPVTVTRYLSTPGVRRSVRH